MIGDEVIAIWEDWFDESELCVVEPLVRCADCKYEHQCRKAVEHITYEPSSVTIGYKVVEYCSYGERKDNE